MFGDVFIRTRIIHKDKIVYSDLIAVPVKQFAHTSDANINNESTVNAVYANVFALNHHFRLRQAKG